MAAKQAEKAVTCVLRCCSEASQSRRAHTPGNCWNSISSIAAVVAEGRFSMKSLGLGVPTSTAAAALPAPAASAGCLAFAAAASPPAAAAGALGGLPFAALPPFFVATALDTDLAKLTRCDAQGCKA